MLTSKQRAYLSSLANEIKPFMQVGKEGLQEEGLEHIQTALEANELLKVKVFADDSSELKEVAEKICDYTGAECVRIIGKTIIIYRPAEKPRIELSD